MRRTSNRRSTRSRPAAISRRRSASSPQSQDGVGQRRRVAGRHQQAGLAVGHDFRVAADARRHDRHAATPSLPAASATRPPRATAARTGRPVAAAPARRAPGRESARCRSRSEFRGRLAQAAMHGPSPAISRRNAGSSRATSAAARTSVSCPFPGCSRPTVTTGPSPHRARSGSASCRCRSRRAAPCAADRPADRDAGAVVRDAARSGRSGRASS